MDEILIVRAKYLLVIKARFYKSCLVEMLNKHYHIPGDNSAEIVYFMSSFTKKKINKK